MFNWFRKKQTPAPEIITVEDNSHALKKGEFKTIVLKAAEDSATGFSFAYYKNGCYTFQRTRVYKQWTIYETLHIVFSLQAGEFVCSVVSRLNPVLLKSNSYNRGLINPHVDLIVLKLGTGVIPIEQASYFHNGLVMTTTKVVASMFDDIKTYGLPFLDRQFKRLHESLLVNTGLDAIKAFTYDKATLAEEIEAALRQGKHWIPSIKHPLYIGLKETLQAVPGQTRDDRKEIPRLAYDLIELYSVIR